MKLSLSLIANGRLTDGQSYTPAERKLALNIAQAVGTAAGLLATPCDEESVVAVVANVASERALALNGQEDSLGGLCRACYRKVEEAMLADPTSTTDFPKVKGGERAPRDWQSVNILFRGAFKELRMDQKIIDQVFKPYRPNKKTA